MASKSPSLSDSSQDDHSPVCRGYSFGSLSCARALLLRSYALPESTIVMPQFGL